MNKLSDIQPVKVDQLGPIPRAYPNDRFIDGVWWRDDREMEWSGPLWQVLDGLKPVAPNPTGAEMEKIFWHPSLVLRAIIESSVGGPGRVEMINLATNLGLSLYAGIPAQEKFEVLSSMAKKHGLNNNMVGQPHDEYSLEASKDAFSDESADRLANLVDKDDPLLIMPVCHSGFIPALRMALQYQRLRPNADTAIYPVRLSHYKLGEDKAYLKKAEAAYIKRIARDRTLIIADDDADSGSTLQAAVRRAKTLAPDNTVIGIVNVDHRCQKALDVQGKLWELAQSTRP